MKQQLSRRDFLKLLSAFPIFHIAHKLGVTELNNDWQPASKQSTQPNIIILLFDALTARNISLYGYPRRTMPNLEKFSERATVYHRHYASSNGTAQSTASFFTGLHPWLHKVHNYYDKITEEALNNNLFKQIKRSNLYHSFVYTDNLQAETLLHQFDSDIDHHLSMGALGEFNYLLHDKLTRRDGSNSIRGLDILMSGNDSERLSGSLVGSVLIKMLRDNHEKTFHNLLDYPRGIGYSANGRVAFTLEKSFDGIKDTLEDLENLEKPYIAYYHMYFPHAPYRPNKKFLDYFKDDGFQPVFKDPHPLLTSIHKQKILFKEMRRYYDEYIANIDFEFGLLIDRLERIGILENSYLIVTSDHGEMFERGLIGHGSPLLYESNIHVPLVIAKPGQRIRKDVFSLTSTVDILPTLLEMTGQPVPKNFEGYEGQVLPEFGENKDDNRFIYSMITFGNSAFSPIQKASFAMFHGDYKLIEYYRYTELERSYELYNLSNDPEELDDLSESKKAIADEMRAILKSRIDYISK